MYPLKKSLLARIEDMPPEFIKAVDDNFWKLIGSPQADRAEASSLSGLLADKESGEGQELNKGHYHEIIDRGHLICSVIDDFMIDHPGMTEEMNELCREAQQKLCRVANVACGEEDRNFGG